MSVDTKSKQRTLLSPPRLQERRTLQIDHPMAKRLLRKLKSMQLGTFLEDFKRRGHNAHPYIVFTFFTELLFQKGIVLVRGDVINNTLTKPEAEKLWSMLEVSYCHSANF
jgi:hypothetical protein